MPAPHQTPGLSLPRLPALATLLAALAALLTLALTPTPAFAKKIYFPGPSFGSEGSGNGQFKEPVGVAVNDSAELGDEQAGDVYVADTGNKRVEVFSSAGVFQGQFNGSGEYEVTVAGKLEKKTGAAAPGGAFTAPEQVAVDNSTEVGDPSKGDVYVTDTVSKAIDKFTAKGEYLEQITKTEGCEKEELPEEVPPCPAGTGNPVAIPFGELRNVIVDAAGDLWVFEAVRPEPNTLGVVDEFNEDGGLLKRFITWGAAHNNHGFAVEDAGDIYVGLGVDETVEKRSASGSSKAGLDTFSEGASAVVVVPSASGQLENDVMVDKGGSVALYAPITQHNQQPLESFPGAAVPVGFEGLSGSEGLAVNAAATVFASERGAGADRVQSFEYVPVPGAVTGAPSGVSETALTLRGTVNPEGETVKECFFDYGTEAGKYTAKAPCEHEKPLEGGEAVPVTAKLSGLPAAGVRSFRVVAVSALGVPGDGAGLSVARPVVSGEGVSGVGSVAATVGGGVDPGGLASCYWVEYGASVAYGSRVPAGEGCISVGEGDSPVAVSAALSALQPGTSYHFRIVARNALGSASGPDFLFATYGATVTALPDGRVYELVSPPVGAAFNGDAYIPRGMWPFDEFDRKGTTSDLPFQAAAGGDALAYAGEPPPQGGDGRVGVTGGNEFVARRAPGGGWSAVDLQAPGEANTVQELSPGLSVGVLRSAEQLSAGAPAGYNNVYRRAIPGESAQPPGGFEASITAAPGCPAEDFGALQNGRLNVGAGLLVAGGNAGTASVPAYSHVLFESNGALPSTPAAGEGCPGGNDLYDSVGGQLYLLNVLPDGKVEPNATVGRQGPSPSDFKTPEISGAVSADGSRVYWSAVEPVELQAGGEIEERPKALYVRENDTQPESEVEEGVCTQPGLACTVQVDAAQAACSEAVCGKGKERGGLGRFLTASADGSRVLFTDERRLTSGSTAVRGAPDLYQYDLQAPEGERLVDLSVDENPGEHANVAGILGASEDGEYVYFAAGGVLAGNENNSGEKATPQGCAGGRNPTPCNVYVRHGGVSTFIATLTGGDGDFPLDYEEGDGDWQADPGRRTAEVSADGHSVVFMSRVSLTGYPNGGLTEVFVYDADTGRVVCASCNPTGEPPVGWAEPHAIFGSFVPVSESPSSYQPRVISADGSRVFFDSVEPLVAQDTNGFLDVYEWEREGVGSCPVGRGDGCIFLLSGGVNDENSFLVDASASGDDVFFVSRADLVKADRTDYEVVYDARVGGVEESEELSCSGTGCQGIAPAPPVFATPSSASITGVDDVPAPPSPAVVKPKPKPVKCKKGFAKNRKRKCVRVKGKKKKSKAARSNRRPGR